jgi:hypothetical protein
LSVLLQHRTLKPVGSVQEVSLARMLHDGKDASKVTIGDLMARPLPTLDVITHLDEAYRLLLAGYTGVLATQVPDLTLRLAEVTAALHMPAALIPSLLLYATQDYWHEVEARFADDWPALTHGATSLPASKIEDYIAALGSGGPLRPR